MINKDEFIKMLAFEADVLLRQTADLTQADSLLQPQPGGNCLNWVVGHLVVNLVDILSTLGGTVPAGLPDLAHYGYGSEPVLGDGAGVLELPVLLDAYAELTQTVTNRLAQMETADFDEEIEAWQGTQRRGYMAFFYFFHHSYHLGQLEQLRNLAGRTEKVI
ncbi:MAG: DinB family protein [Brevefilum sp.]